jgi:hypothetical protein
VNEYTIAITREGHNAQMILKIDDSGNAPRIAELWVRPVEGGSLSAQELPSIDLDLLLRALRPSATGPGGVLTATATIAGSDAAADRPALSLADQPTKGLGSAEVAQSADRSGGAAQPTASTAERERRRVRPAVVGGARAYRRIPDDLAATYATTGSVTAVAKHYGVPRHTAQGWIGRLRRQAS